MALIPRSKVPFYRRLQNRHLILIATVSFGIVPDVRQTFHLGPPHDVETYMQEIRRGGRGSALTFATLFLF